MAWVPTKIRARPDERRGWRASARWHCYDTETRAVDQSKRFDTKRACQVECDARNAKASEPPEQQNRRSS